LKYNRRYHPAFAVGYVTVFACLVFISILAMTGIVPVALQPPLMISILITVIMGGVIGLAGFFKSYNRQAYPVLVGTLLISLIVFVIWVLTR